MSITITSLSFSLSFVSLFSYKWFAQLAGITKPNDEQCHIKKRDNYVYRHERLHDYPSVAQINRQMAENSMNVIFTVPRHVYSVYRDLQKRLQGSRVGLWSDNLDNIVELIRHQYNVSKLVSSFNPLSHDWFILVFITGNTFGGWITTQSFRARSNSLQIRMFKKPFGGN